MMALKDYNIAFVGLKNGSHPFDFHVNQSFFDAFDGETSLETDIQVDLKLIKTETLITLQFGFKGVIITDCDRCLDIVKIPVREDHEIFVKFKDDQPRETDENVIYISPDDDHIDVSKLIYDFVLLALPVQKFCNDAEPPKACNPEVTKFIDQNGETKTTDPRWSVLDQLKEDK